MNLTKSKLQQIIKEEIYEAERIEVPAESPLSDEQEAIVARFEVLVEGWQPMSDEGGQYTSGTLGPYRTTARRDG